MSDDRGNRKILFGFQQFPVDLNIILNNPKKCLGFYSSCKANEVFGLSGLVIRYKKNAVMTHKNGDLCRCILLLRNFVHTLGNEIQPVMVKVSTCFADSRFRQNIRRKWKQCNVSCTLQERNLDRPLDSIKVAQYFYYYHVLI